jgi:hypothetical protein
VAQEKGFRAQTPKKTKGDPLDAPQEKVAYLSGGLWQLMVVGRPMERHHE